MKDPKAITATKPKKSELGISRAVYAIGNSVKDSFIWGTAAMLTTIGIMSVGASKQRHLGKVRDMISEWHGKAGKAISGFLLDYLKIDVSGPIVAAGFAVGWVVSHLVQVPSSIRGWKQVQKAEQKHQNLSIEKAKLLAANADLVIENQAYKKELEQYDPSFTSRIQPRPLADVTQSRLGEPENNISVNSR